MEFFSRPSNASYAHGMGRGFVPKSPSGYHSLRTYYQRRLEGNARSGRGRSKIILSHVYGQTRGSKRDGMGTGKSFVCYLCSHEYPRESTLKNHLKVYHKVEQR